MRTQRILVTVLIIVALSLSTIPKQAYAYDKMIYWSDDTGINRINPDGTGRQQIIPYESGYWGYGLAIDSSAGKMYWTEGYYGTGAGKIRCSNLDGSNAQTIVTGLAYPCDMALDTSAGKIYWTEDFDIKRANLDGSKIYNLSC